MNYILASASPRRSEILKSIGLDFKVVVAETDEDCDIDDPCQLTETLAARKGRDVWITLSERGEAGSDTVVISADTVVFCNGEVLGKPRDREDARRMLRLLSDNVHTVITGIALTCDGKTVTSHSETKVSFSDMSDSDIEFYLDSGEPFDKAGAYGIQGKASIWIKKIDGCYFNVVGLPVNCLCDLASQSFGRLELK